MKKLRLTFGIMLMPLFAIIYFADRIMTIFMPWIEHVKINKWFAGQKEMVASFIRVLTALLLFGLYSLFIWLL